MNMSDKKQQNVFDAISSSVMGMRIEIESGDLPLTKEQIDNRLSSLDILIWGKVKTALKIEGL